MPTPQTRLDLDRIVSSVDAPIVFAVIINEDNVPETVSKGIVDDKHWFYILQQLTLQAAEVVYDSFTSAEKAQMRIVLPTAEDAQRLGILRPRR